MEDAKEEKRDMKKIYINADDFGFSHGINLAIFKGCHEGIINSTSIMMNQAGTDEAILLSKKMRNIDIGLHINLTNGYPVNAQSKVRNLVDKEGKFCCGFIKLMFRTMYLKEIRFQIWREIEAQIKAAIRSNIVLSHIDGHRHIQMIPLIYKITTRLQKKYTIGRLRIINESILQTWKDQQEIGGIRNGGIIKYFVLTFLRLLTRAKSNIYFFSIIYTGEMSSKVLKKVKIPNGYSGIEIMMHPGLPDVDKQNISSFSDKNIISKTRETEFLAILDKNCIKDMKNDKGL